VQKHRTVEPEPDEWGITWPPVGSFSWPRSLEFEESRLVLRVHRSRERNRSAVRQKKGRALDESGLICEACREDYTTKYAERGHGIIECHHRVPPSHLTPGKKPRLSDLALVCANCHRLVHCRQPRLEWHQLLALVAPPPSGPDS
jgi:5-methylcytosine-specific restriction protein A